MNSRWKIITVVLAVVAGMFVLSLVMRAISGPPDPLVSAIAMENEDKLRQLIADGHDLNAILPNGETPLHVACRLAKVDSVKMLLELNADPAGKNMVGRSPWEEMWQRMEDREFTTLQSRVLAALVAAGYRPTTPSGPENQSLLHLVAAQTRSAELIELLVEEQAHSLTAVDNFGWTPLHAAAHGRNYEGCQALAELGADVNAETTKTKENEAVKAYLEYEHENIGVDDGNVRSQAREYAKRFPGDLNKSYYFYQVGSRPIDLAPRKLKRLEKNVRKLLDSYGAKPSEHVENTHIDDSYQRAQ